MMGKLEVVGYEYSWLTLGAEIFLRAVAAELQGKIRMYGCHESQVLDIWRRIQFFSFREHGKLSCLYVLWSVRQKNPYISVSLNFCSGSPCSKAPGSSGAWPVKLLGYSEPVWNGEGKTVFFLVTSCFGSDWRTQYKNCVNRKASFDLNKTV